MSKIVFRVLDFFEAFAAAQRPLVLSEMARILDIPPSSCHGVLRALEKRGYLYELKPRAGFYPTSRMLELSREIAEHDPSLIHIEPTLQTLLKAAGESVFLSRAHGISIVYLAVLHADRRLRLDLQPGDHVRSMYASSAGKAVLATLAPKSLADFLDTTDLRPLTPMTNTTRAAIEADLRLSEQRGWFVNREETVEDSLTISARFVFNDTLFILTIAGSLKPMERKLDQLTGQLLATVRQLERRGPASAA